MTVSNDDNESNNNLFFIGDYDIIKEYDYNNINLIPLKNLPMIYFPFNYNEDDKTIDNIQEIVPIIKSFYDKNDNIKNINTEKLLTLLGNLSENWQPYNNNNITSIRYFVYFLWIVILFIILKLLYIYYNEYYTYIIISITCGILLIATCWSIINTSRNLK